MPALAAAVASLLLLLSSGSTDAFTSAARPRVSTSGYIHQPIANVGGSRRLDAVAMARSAPCYRRRVAMAAPAPTKEAGPSIGWDSHKAVDSVPESLVRGVEGNESMRRRFEKACREAQVRR